MLFGLVSDRETRAAPTTITSDYAGGQVFEFFHGVAKANNIRVDEETALGVPAIWAAVNNIAGTIGHLPLHLYRISNGQPVKDVKNPLYRAVHDNANAVMTAFEWKKWLVTRALLPGRALSLILIDGANRTVGFLPLDETKFEITQTVANGVVSRTYKDRETGKAYDHTQIIDIAPTLKRDGLSAYSPISVNGEAIRAIIAAEAYATAIMANGGTPPLIMTGPPSSPAAADRAEEQITRALKKGKDEGRVFFQIPNGYDIKEVGFDPAKLTLIELRKWQVSEVSRIFNIAPALLHDLTTGTYSNVEHQSIYYAQQTILPLVKLIEQQLNLKLFGKKNNTSYVEFNMDGLVRGDLLSRTEAMSKAVTNGIRTPNEVRALDNLPPMENGDKLYIQGATVPLGSDFNNPNNPPSNEDNDDNGEA